MSDKIKEKGILSGMRVIEGSAFIAAPLGGMTLAQMGADVIRFDNIGGGIDAKRSPLTKNGNSIYWAGWNKGKRSLMVDIHSSEGKELISELITAPGKDAGFFLTNLPMRNWLAYETLQKRRLDLVAVSISGSSDGRTAVDYTINAATGFPYINGSEREINPVNNPLPVWDMLAGNTAATALLAGERHRTRTREGQLISISLSDIAFNALANSGITTDLEINGIEREKHGNNIYGAYGQDFLTSEGRRVMVVAISKRMWESVVIATGLGPVFKELETKLNIDLNDEQIRYRYEKDISSILRPWFEARTLESISHVFTKHGVCWEPFQTFSQVINEDIRFSEQNPIFAKLDQPGIGTYLASGSPIHFNATEMIRPKPAPTLGQHTDEILSEILGLTSKNISDLHDRQIISDSTRL